jgi:hypothetical protein
MHAGERETAVPRWSKANKVAYEGAGGTHKIRSPVNSPTSVGMLELSSLLYILLQGNQTRFKRPTQQKITQGRALCTERRTLYEGGTHSSVSWVSSPISVGILPSRAFSCMYLDRGLACELSHTEWSVEEDSCTTSSLRHTTAHPSTTTALHYGVVREEKELYSQIPQVAHQPNLCGNSAD